MDAIPRAAAFRAACAMLGRFRCRGAADASTAIQWPGKWGMVRDDEGGAGKFNQLGDYKF